jgi:hypothetical protein
MRKNKNALTNESNNNVNSKSILSQWDRLCKQAYDEICEVCENGSLKDLIMLRAEVASEKTNNKRDLLKIDRAIRERFA